MQSSSATESAPTSAHKNVRAVSRKLNAQMVTYFSQHENELLSLLRQRVLDFSLGGVRQTSAQSWTWKQLRDFLDTDPAAFKTQFHSALEKSLDQEVQAVLRGSALPDVPGAKAELKSEQLSLSLMNVSDLDLKLSQARAAQLFNARYEDIMVKLTLRLRSLFGVEAASMQSNPYRPEILVNAFTQALIACRFKEEDAVNALRAFTPDSCLDLTPLYAELEAILIRSGVSSVSHRVLKSGIEARGSAATGPGEASAHSGFSQSGMQTSYPGGVASGWAPGYADGGYPSGAGMSSGYMEGFPGGYQPGLARGLHPGSTGGGPLTGHGQGYGSGESHWPPVVQARAFLQKLYVDNLAAGMAVPEGATMDSGQARSWLSAASEPGFGVVPIQPYLLRYLEELHGNVLQSLSSQDLDIDLGLDLDLSQGDPNVLRKMRADEEIRNAEEFDRGTVDALAEVFEFVFSDPTIASHLKVVIGRLQIPVLKAALMDRNFFFSQNHPARKLVDALAAAAMAWSVEKGLDDPLCLQIEATVKRILTEFDQDLALFNEVLLEFEEFLTQDERRLKQQVQPLANAQEAEEALEAARAQVDAMLRERIATLAANHEKTLFLLPFLTNQWREVLAQAYVHHDSQPDAWTQLLTTTDQLIWSTQRKNNSEERRELVTVLPKLVRQLNASLDALEWSGDERETFTRRLIATHMNAIRSVPDPSQESEFDSQDLRAGDEAVLKLDLRIASAQETEPESLVPKLPEFERGMWFEFLDESDLSRRYRLTWISPQRRRFLFTNREGFEAFVRSERELKQLLLDGQLRTLPSEPLVARAIDHILAASDVPVVA